MDRQKYPDIAAMMFKHLTEQPIVPRQLNPQLPTHIEQAILKAMEKEFQDRHTDIATFITALQTTSQQWLDKGNTLYKRGRFQEAVAAFEQAIRLNPNDAPAYYNKGLALERLGRKKEARRAYEKARQLGYRG